MQLTDLPHLNVALNGASAILLTAGYAAIRAKRIQLHKALMLSALATSIAFLTSYLIYHFGVRLTKPYTGGWRTLYLVILFSHIVLAIVNLPLVIATVYRAFRKQFDKHRRIARITFPIWWYVSVTGVVVYFMLY